MGTKLGLVGGIGPESTLLYYRALVEGYRARTGDGSYPNLVIDSVDMQAMLALVERDDRDGLTSFLVAAVRRLAAAGAQVAAIASNTPHLVFDRVQADSPLPLVSIVRATRDAVAARGLSRVGLLGTRATMERGFFDHDFAAAGVGVAVPPADERAYVHDRIFAELEHGIVTPETRRAFLAIVAGMRERDGVEGLILGCTELPLILSAADFPDGLPVFDTVAVHVAALVERMAGKKPVSPAPPPAG